jgi:hypothetical protein
MANFRQLKPVFKVYTNMVNFKKKDKLPKVATIYFIDYFGSSSICQLAFLSTT